MQIFDLKAVESLGLPIEVIDGVPCIVASNMNFVTLQGARNVTFSIPNSTADEPIDAITTLLGATVVDGVGNKVMLTNLHTFGGFIGLRGLFLPQVSSTAETARLDTARVVGVRRLNLYTMEIFVSVFA